MTGLQLSMDQLFERRERAAARVEDNESEAWKEAAEATILRMAAKSIGVTSDDVRSLVGDPPNSPNAMGAVFLRLQKQGVIHQVGFVRSTRVIGNGNKIAIWRAS